METIWRITIADISASTPLGVGRTQIGIFESRGISIQVSKKVVM